LHIKHGGGGGVAKSLLRISTTLFKKMVKK